MATDLSTDPRLDALLAAQPEVRVDELFEIYAELVAENRPMVAMI